MATLKKDLLLLVEIQESLTNTRNLMDNASSDLCGPLSDVYNTLLNARSSVLRSVMNDELFSSFGMKETIERVLLEKN